MKLPLICGDSSWNDIHSATGTIELHLAINEGPDGVIAAEADIQAGLELGSTLADDDVSGDDGFPAEFFHAESLADAIASVFDAALSFFMGHGILLG